MTEPRTGSRRVPLLPLVLVALAGCATGATLHGASIAGVVVDRGSGRPLAGAEVFAIQSRRRMSDLEGAYAAVRWATTDREGRFRIEAGRKLARAKRLGFEVYHPDYGLLPIDAAGPRDALRLELYPWYADPERRRRAVWEKALACPESLPDFCLHRCRVMIGRPEICRDPRTIRSWTAPMPEDFEPARPTPPEP